MFANLRECCPNCDINFINGGIDGRWLAPGLSVPASARSRPMDFGSLARQQYLHMLDITDRGIAYDYLVVLDSDMMIIKPGFEAYLGQLLDTYAYIGTRLGPVLFNFQMEPFESVIREWASLERILDAPTPYVVFNPGQIFRRDLVKAILEDPAIPRIIDEVAAIGVTHAEELIWPTYAVSRGFPTTNNPGSHGMEWRGYSADELTLMSADPSVFLIHKVSMDVGGEDRLAIRRMSKKLPEPDEIASAAKGVAHQRIPVISSPNPGLRRNLRTLSGSLRAVILDVSTLVRRRSRRLAHRLTRS
jgi:hypothetical protein